ncbi:DgyrCDS7394 [Dimorphilus gyrociliatus]|uniref:DgyrCDS7394 n=1 Tax=Dimorphilus gyrociliatus TaxID=2664684 RepID=A0A7I8VT53_9ANNE|nr:DgyrCDS7394 [Dimorphilus gyrociliatus]
MKERLIELVARNLAKPRNSLSGLIIGHYFLRRRNRTLEENAVKLSKIEKDHTVLEIGFGPGVGLSKAVEKVQDGKGKIYGIELSLSMVNSANLFYKKYINAGKLDITYGSVTQLPYAPNTFDRIYHVNCYYFWKDMPLACTELYRVLKPNSYVVATLNLERLKLSKKKGLMKYASFDPIKYMHALESAGFENVKIEYLNGYQAIYGHIASKPQMRIIDETIVKANK